jgi:hypothetical protein
MLTRLLLIALLGVSLASAKTYTFTLSNTSHAGSTTLKPGQYTLKVNGSKVLLKDSAGKDVPTNTKVETANQPYKATEVSMTQSNGGEKIEWIGLAGSKSRVVFE